tara:strand:- start:417 stop:632 length:216 start_codon:yes stop_codon:yes gene_type:complete
MENNLVPVLSEKITKLEKDVESLKEDKDYLYNKLEKALGDRIELRAENHKLKKQVNGSNGNSEEECLACSA